MKKKLLDIEKLRQYLNENDYVLEGIEAFNCKEGGHILLPLSRTKFLKDILALGSLSQEQWDEFWNDFLVEVDV